MSLRIAVQRASLHAGIPSERECRLWAVTALSRAGCDSAEVTVRIVDRDEMRNLNQRFRRQDRPTNVLSFPFDQLPPSALQVFGDVVVCAPVVADEAERFSCDPGGRWAHMIVHGVLHLCGYHHQDDGAAREMESLERSTLAGLGLPDPYAQAPLPA